ncbi:hypothetical protein [Ureibacillus manganicus]|uniref:Uncharacterized protein n=1 Tax=Ureibacillus manganicus DSM 26584 TaxID=1384049 RepID=A0A0A3IF93_9BACL|nr:hypothetical protein [Ureibacillus manganicus]KGR73532.1 hypothetical protein CD29_19810 [Ureibacillus manganicus DSM 26584]
MQLHEILIFGGIWGWLMIFFLTPPHHNVSNEPQEKSSIMTFSKVFQISLIRVVLHKKAILALVLFVATIIYFWSYFESIEVYRQIHGEDGFRLISPKVDGIYYVFGVTIYTAVLYLCAVINRADKLIKSTIE